MRPAREIATVGSNSIASLAMTKYSYSTSEFICREASSVRQLADLERATSNLKPVAIRTNSP